jgi:predicted transcriptional regulator
MGAWITYVLLLHASTSPVSFRTITGGAKNKLYNIQLKMTIVVNCFHMKEMDLSSPDFSPTLWLNHHLNTDCAQQDADTRIATVTAWIAQMNQAAKTELGELDSLTERITASVPRIQHDLQTLVGKMGGLRVVEQRLESRIAELRIGSDDVLSKEELP